MAETKLPQKLSLSKPIHIIGDIWLVPCVANKQENNYSPIPRPLDQSLKSDQFSKKHFWTSEEDQALISIVSKIKSKPWNQVAKILNEQVHKNIPIRKGRQCRERWLNFLNPDLKREKWTPQEDELLLKLHQQLGNKWSEISRRIHGRNERSVKSRFKALQNVESFDDLMLDEISADSFDSVNTFQPSTEFESFGSEDIQGFDPLFDFEGLDLIV